MTAAFAISVIATVAGIAIYGLEHAGVLPSNLTNAAPWGLYLSCFMFFAGIGAGCLIAAVAPRAFGIASLDTGMERLMCWTAFAAFVTAGVFITVDLGGPLRMAGLLASPNPASPLFLDVIALPAAIVLSAAASFALPRMGRGAARTFRFVLAAWGVFVLCVDAWILCSQGAHEAWRSAILLPWFVVTGVLCGFAVQAVACALMRRPAGSLGKALAAFIVIDALLYAFDLMCATQQVAALATTGVLAPLFWGQMLLYALALVLCLAFPGKGRALGAAGACIVAGVLLKRVALMAAGFQVPALQLPNASMPVLTDALVYAPAASEVVCAAGFAGLCAFIVLLGVRFLGCAGGPSDK